MKNIDTVLLNDQIEEHTWLLQLFNEIAPIIGILPIKSIFNLNWEQWLEISARCSHKGYLPQSFVAKNIGMDIRNGSLKKPLISKD